MQILLDYFGGTYYFRVMVKLARLTPALLEVLKEAAEGWTSAETGEHLGKSGETVKVQRQAIVELWGANNLVHAVVMGMRAGVIR